MRHLSALALLVRDYDEAIAWYRAALAFEVVEDTDLGNGKRWVLMAPGAAQAGVRLLLARAKDAEEAARIGDQTGGRVFLFLDTDDFERDYARLKAQGAAIEGTPRNEVYGRVVVFRDLYGNRWDLVARPRSAGVHG